MSDDISFGPPSSVASEGILSGDQTGLAPSSLGHLVGRTANVPIPGTTYQNQPGVVQDQGVILGGTTHPVLIYLDAIDHSFFSIAVHLLKRFEAKNRKNPFEALIHQLPVIGEVIDKVKLSVFDMAWFDEAIAGFGTSLAAVCEGLQIGKEEALDLGFTSWSEDVELDRILFSLRSNSYQIQVAPSSEPKSPIVAEIAQVSIQLLNLIEALCSVESEPGWEEENPWAETPWGGQEVSVSNDGL